MAQICSRSLRVLLLCSLLFLVACVSQPIRVTREPVAMAVVAADTCSPLTRALTEAYAEQRPWVEVAVVSFNNDVALETVRAGEAEIAFLSWPPPNTAGDESDALWQRSFVQDGAVVIAHSTSPITQTTLAGLRQIYSGRVQEWGGLVIAVVTREDGSGIRAAFDAYVLGGLDVTLTAVVMPSNEAVMEYVAGTPGAIGYVSSFWLAQAAEDGPGEAVRALPVDGVAPGRRSIEDSRYPIAFPLYLATVGDPVGEAREFAQWVLGPGQSVVSSLR
jgi:phosphate transport system substrate-binding protein